MRRLISPILAKPATQRRDGHPQVGTMKPNFRSRPARTRVSGVHARLATQTRPTTQSLHALIATSMTRPAWIQSTQVGTAINIPVVLVTTVIREGGVDDHENFCEDGDCTGLSVDDGHGG